MRYFLRILAVLLAGTGVVWILQGINVLPGSFMTGDIRWAYWGALAVVAGVVLGIFSFRLAKPSTRDSPQLPEKR